MTNSANDAANGQNSDLPETICPYFVHRSFAMHNGRTMHFEESRDHVWIARDD
ncbi:hypothetical protein MCOR25_001308 [Pyricularia grisea]|nr:hypothetical protein MCOR25_001308 [Pyricularia grisea]